MRINVIPPEYLTDNHLIAEYREIKMAPHYYRKSKNSNRGIDRSRISEHYVLNSGHAYFWYNKMGYVRKRFYAIIKEMRSRGFTTNYTDISYLGVARKDFGDYDVTVEDLKLNLERILDRINKQPHWYKYKGSSVPNWSKFYNKLL